MIDAQQPTMHHCRQRKAPAQGLTEGHIRWCSQHDWYLGLDEDGKIMMHQRVYDPYQQCIETTLHLDNFAQILAEAGY